jgi:tRNA pseudouridine38-40 synthase
MTVRRLKLTVAYDGGAYHGFQRQQNAIAVQQVLEERLAPLFGHELRMNGAGRTDTGVHAWGQVVHFDTDGRIPAERIPKASRGMLPRDIAVVAAEEVEASFHARKSAVAKRYLYRLRHDSPESPFGRFYAWTIAKKLDVAAMEEATRHILGKHDFSSFRAVGSAPVQPVRTIFSAGWQAEGNLLTFHVCGDGFLYHMVRNLASTFAAVGSGALSIADFLDLIAAKDRHLAPPTAPPQGLFLQKIFYEWAKNEIYFFQGIDSRDVF